MPLLITTSRLYWYYYIVPLPSCSTSVTISVYYNSTALGLEAFIPGKTQAQLAAAPPEVSALSSLTSLHSDGVLRVGQSRGFT